MSVSHSECLSAISKVLVGMTNVLVIEAPKKPMPTRELIGEVRVDGELVDSRRLLNLLFEQEISVRQC